jgi:arabinose-5-phosphate isomerase
MSTLSVAKKLIKDEAIALEVLSNALGASFEMAVDLIVSSIGRIVITGVGKSGHIGQKIASTLSSTGTPSFFIHPTEASHGDLGMIKSDDLVIVISRSGESAEIFDLLEYCRRLRINIISITTNHKSTVAKASTISLELPDIPEACSLKLAPTSSTIMTLALGDALAIACLQAKNFTKVDFGNLHPGGRLGQKLRPVKDLMHKGAEMPIVDIHSRVSDAILEMTRCTFGCVGVVDNVKKLIGIFTDGDLRRKLSPMIIERRIVDLMTYSPFSLSPDCLAADAAALFIEKRIPSCFVTENDVPIGIIHLHDLTRAGIV